MGRITRPVWPLVLSAYFALGAALDRAHAYTPTVTSSGIPVRWKGSVKLDLAGNPENQNGIHDTAFFDAVVRGLQRWKTASGGPVQFDYWQGSDPGTYVPESEYDGLSTIYFASNSRGAQKNLSSNVLGLTQVWYDTKTGRILEADILLNDRDFRFTTDVRDTSGYGSGGASFSGGKSSVFIENVITHELGHAYGLSHSGGLQSSMLFMESPEQAHLGCDELTAVRALYPSVFGNLRGTMTGQVVTETGAPVFGAHVLAISRRRGTVLGSGLTDPSGNFTIAALEPGTYFLMAEPFYAGAQSLPSYFSGVRSEICPGGRAFSRTPLTERGSKSLIAVNVGVGRVSPAPVIRVQCSGESGAAIPDSDATVLYSGSGGGFGIVDRFETSMTRSYRLDGAGGRLELRVLSYSLYSPIAVEVSLVDLAGRPVEARVMNRVYQGDSGYVNHDAAVVAEALPRGDYILRVEASFLDSRLYPAGPVAVDWVPFLMVTGSVNEAEPPLLSEIPFNARCRMDESFPAYQSPPGAPVRHDTDEDGGIAFCGTTRTDAPRGPGMGQGMGPGSGAPPAAILGWFLPWAAMVGIWGYFRTGGAARRRAGSPLSVAANVGQ